MFIIETFLQSNKDKPLARLVFELFDHNNNAFLSFLNAFSMCSSANQFFSFILGQVCRKQLSSILDSALELTLTRLVIPCGWLIVLFFW